jgi:3-hydroxyisobutyrate dehydrogenase-like beta-hydroxyacid dehydrogenase
MTSRSGANGQVSAVDLAKKAGVSPKAFRAALRKAGFDWHQHRAPWVADRGSQQERDMRNVLRSMSRDA